MNQTFIMCAYLPSSSNGSILQAHTSSITIKIFLNGTIITQRDLGGIPLKQTSSYALVLSQR